MTRAYESVLAIGAHPDDVELGCGGTLAAYRAAGARVSVLVLTNGTNGRLADTCRRMEQEEAAVILGAELYWGGFVDGSVDDGVQTVRRIEEVVRHVDATMVFTHSVHDSHQDHRAAAFATLGAARFVPTVLHYESPSTIGFQPSAFVDVSAVMDTKLQSLRAHLSQILRGSLAEVEASEAQCRYRGWQARCRFAEGFAASRMLLPVAGSRPAEQVAAAHVIDLTAVRSSSPTPENQPNLAGAHHE